MENPTHIRSIAEAHKGMGLAPPKHPLISLIYHRDLLQAPQQKEGRMIFDYYMIAYKDTHEGSIGYGRSAYDFSEGSLIFTKPGQVMTFKRMEIKEESQGWFLIFHPDLIRKSSLATRIEGYTFFSYEVHEALHISEQEKDSIWDLAKKIQTEYDNPIDSHTQTVMVSTLELLLSYCTRFYDRQFYTRANSSKDFVTQFDQLLRAYFISEKPQEKGIPSVKYFADALSMSKNYLSDMLRKETGSGTKDHINSYIVEQAKNRLLGSQSPVSHIAYELGFEYPAHFTKLFKSKTGMSPVAYRNLN